MFKDYIVEIFMKTNLFRMIEERENFQNIVEESIKNLEIFLGNKSSEDIIDDIVDSIKKIKETSLQTSKKRAIYDVIDGMNLSNNSQKIMSFINDEFLELCFSDEEMTKEKILEILNEDI